MVLRGAPPARGPLARPDGLDRVERAVSFGHRTGWLAIRHDEPGAVLRAIGARDVRRAAWSRGVYAAYPTDHPRDNAFVTPALDGWVLVATSLLLEPGPAGDPLRGLLERLSRELDTTVQGFANHSGLDLYLWGWAERGELRRCHGESAFAAHDDDGDATGDPTTCDVGPPTVEERELGLGGRPVTAEDVIRLAAAWSLDPTRLEQRYRDVAPLWVCTVPAAELR